LASAVVRYYSAFLRKLLAWLRCSAVAITRLRG